MPFGLSEVLLWPPERQCRMRGMRPWLHEMPSGPTGMRTSQSTKTWTSAIMKRRPICAARPRDSAMPWLRWKTSLLVSYFYFRVLLPNALFLFLISHTFLLDAEAWPASEEAANAAVAKSREEAVAARGPARTDADAWTRQEYIIATAARIPII